MDPFLLKWPNLILTFPSFQTFGFRMFLIWITALLGCNYWQNMVDGVEWTQRTGRSMYLQYMPFIELHISNRIKGRRTKEGRMDIKSYCGIVILRAFKWPKKKESSSNQTHTRISFVQTRLGIKMERKPNKSSSCTFLIHTLDLRSTCSSGIHETSRKLCNDANYRQ